jgi:succinoglycan biosynthesis transport protein ExoP
MTLPLPLASYLFILRKHRWLVLGFACLILAVGYVYTDRQIPQFKASAKLKIQPRVGLASATTPFDFTESAQFISDQVHTLRTDPRLGERALAFLRGEARERDGEEDLTGTGEDEAIPSDSGGVPMPKVPDRGRFAALTGRQLVGMITVQNVPGTSFWEISAIGPDTQANYAIANAYSMVFERIFREERKRQTMSAQRAFRNKRESLAATLDRLLDDMLEFRKSYPQVDFDSAVNIDRQSVEAFKSTHFKAVSRELELREELVTINDELRAVDLKMEEGDAARGASMVPAMIAEIEKEPRLSARVQSLKVLDTHEGVSMARDRLKGLLEEERRLLSTGLQETSTEVRAVAKGIRATREDLAAQTEAALLRVVAEVRQLRRQAVELEGKIKEYEGRANVTAVALADFETMKRKVVAAEADIARVDAILFEGDKESQRMEDAAGGSVSVREWARAGSGQLVRPNKTVMYLMTVLAAITLAGGLAYILEYLDDTVKTREDFDRLVRLPFLGYVPHIRAEDPLDRDRVVATRKTGSPEVEAFRAIRTGVQFARSDREVRSFLISSAGPNEGKTTVCANLAASFATGATRTLLIDADLRRARVHKALGVDNVFGLTNVLAGGMPLLEAVQKSSVPGLDVLASGPIPPNPAEILGSARMRELLVEAGKHYQYILVDSPPVVAVTDPALLAKHVDAVFLVVSVGKTSVRILHRAREAFAAVGATIHGAIMNNSDEQASIYYYGYYKGRGYTYGYGYSPAENAKVFDAPPPPTKQP